VKAPKEDLRDSSVSSESSSDSLIYMSEKSNYTLQERQYFDSLQEHFDNATGSAVEKLQSFARFVPRQTIATFMAREKIFEMIRNCHGHIVECGVYKGQGLFSWAQLSSIMEPYNHTRRVIGFDSFTGFPSYMVKDGKSDLIYKHEGGLAGSSRGELNDSIALYDLNRLISQIPRVELVEGDAAETIPAYIEENPHLVCALLYLDFDMYEPTKVAIEQFWPRMPVGSIIAFDELNQSNWPGETQALIDTIGIGRLRLERFEFNPQISYAVKSGS